MKQNRRVVFKEATPQMMPHPSSTRHKSSNHYYITGYPTLSHKTTTISQEAKQVMTASASGGDPEHMYIGHAT